MLSDGLVNMVFNSYLQYFIFALNYFASIARYQLMLLCSRASKKRCRRLDNDSFAAGEQRKQICLGLGMKQLDPAEISPE